MNIFINNRGPLCSLIKLLSFYVPTLFLYECFNYQFMFGAQQTNNIYLLFEGGYFFQYTLSYV